ncbi:DUF4244 domain-containing protein [Actinomyces sp. B33]|uniref:DUF4244 domain-containing protein n=1 Tax=Actinomyces sp. B33 TaxID=2942131 RepID=UPI002340BBDE|nr:DUF4244 domain-containing protein [Actinomyces sp. B33]MDC4232355.1 DUF4244 domain-containing protein [Actinomyces sp. B33]
MNLIDHVDRAVIRLGITTAAGLEPRAAVRRGADRNVADEEGSTTVEYAIGAVATAGLAGLLVVVLKSGAVKGLIQGIIESALTL